MKKILLVAAILSLLISPEALAFSGYYLEYEQGVWVENWNWEIGIQQEVEPGLALGTAIQINYHELGFNSPSYEAWAEGKINNTKIRMTAWYKDPFVEKANWGMRFRIQHDWN